jgi:hypothetical protein
MGLRIIARLYDRSEALVMSSCLEAAGVPHWVFGAEIVNINPLHEIVYDGYKLLVQEEHLAPALEILAEAVANPTPCDEQLQIKLYPATFTMFHIVQLALVGILFWVPMRGYRWLPKTT